MKTTAEKFLQALRANVSDFLSDAIDHATFSERQRAIWGRIERAGKAVNDEVHAGLRADLNAGRR